MIGDTTIIVPGGEFEVYVVTEHLQEASESASFATWYVMKSAPRLVARLHAALSNGGTATVELTSIRE